MYCNSVIVQDMATKLLPEISYIGHYLQIGTAFETKSKLSISQS